MKIHNNRPIGGAGTSKKAGRSSADGVFKNLLDAGMQEIQTVQQAEEQPTPQSGGGGNALQALEESVSLLDRAMECLESGENPTPELLQDIQQLRRQVRQQLGAEGQNSEADTLLAVEAERIRSMRL